MLTDVQQAVKDKLTACDSASLLSDSQWSNVAQCSADDIQAYFTQAQATVREGRQPAARCMGLHVMQNRLLHRVFSNAGRNSMRPRLPHCWQASKEVSGPLLP